MSITPGDIIEYKVAYINDMKNHASVELARTSELRPKGTFDITWKAYGTIGK